MDTPHRLVLYHVITPLHVGCGQDVGVVDLPVIRERTTGWPYVPGSGIRGVFRNEIEPHDPETAKVLFGPRVQQLGEREQTETATDSTTGEQAESAVEPEMHAGCVSVYDARILLFPVRSDPGPFRWVTCPTVLRDFDFRLDLFGCRPDLPALDNLDVTEGSARCPGEDAQPLCLEEFRYTVVSEGIDPLTEWSDKLSTLLQRPVASKVVLISDSDFFHFVNFATMVVQRNRLTSVKTVAPGALFSVEAMPPETIFYGFVGGFNSRRPGSSLTGTGSLDKLRSAIGANRNGQETFPVALQIGGDESTGWGVTRTIWIERGPA